MAGFAEIGLSSWLVEQCRQLGLKQPTPVQLGCIPAILEGRDCLGCAKTGSGKTAAFVLPILQKLSEDPYGIFCLVLTPTRELAYQIAEQFRVLGKPLGLKDCIIVGGMDMVAQALELSRKPHVVIATPGRLADHLRSSNTFNMKKIQFLVMDEADRLLEQGCTDFTTDLETILAAVPARRQTLLFSATLTDTLKELQGLATNEPFFWEAQATVRTVEQLDQRYLLVPEKVKDAYLVHLVQTFQDQLEDCSIIIFTNTCKTCQILCMMLRKFNFPTVALHSMMKQKERFAALAKFKSSIYRILIATDVASRGLDIPTVQVVINHNTPGLPKIYIHRVGRTARAGRQGQAITLVTQYDIHLLHAIEEQIKQQLAELVVEEAEVLQILTQVNVVRRECEIKLEASHFDEKKEINTPPAGGTNLPSCVCGVVCWSCLSPLGDPWLLWPSDCPVYPLHCWTSDLTPYLPVALGVPSSPAASTMPILKQLVSSSVNSKRRSRADLTAEMISAPLGDFRHTMHVGRAGDAFGDTSFLTSKAREADDESLDEQASASKLSLLSRKFRGSKRSQSVTRGDREQRDMLGSLRDSALFVKNAMSLPQLNEKEAAEKDSSKLPKSLSSSPVKKADARDGGPKSPHRNGATGPHSPDPLLDEQAFGDLMDLPIMPKVSYGLKHAESILSFHIDLGPSMLGDVLSIMDKDQWGSEEEEEAGGYRDKEGPSSIVQAPPVLEVVPPLGRQESKASWDQASMLPPHAVEDDGWAVVAPSPSSARSVGSHTTRDSSSLSSYTSGVLEERSPAFRGPDRVAAAPPRQPDKEFCFMDEEEEDEIRV